MNIAIRQVRESAGISQAELGRRMGVSQGAIARWESGRRQASVATLQRVADAMNLNLSVIFSALPPQKA